MYTISPNSIHLLNSTQVLTVYKRINIRTIGCIALLGEIEGFEVSIYLSYKQG